MGSATLPEAPHVVGCRVFRGCAGGSLGPAAVGSQPASPRRHLLVFQGCLCPHGGNVKYCSGEGVSSSTSAQGHTRCRVGSNRAVGAPTSPRSEDIPLGRAFFPPQEYGVLMGLDGAFGLAMGNGCDGASFPKPSVLTPAPLPRR